MSEPIPLGPSPGVERRTTTRYLCDLGTTCYLLATVDNDPWLARVRNISAGGISLLLHREIEPGRVVNLDLQNPERHFHCQIAVRIRYIVEHPSGDWIHGCEFLTKLTAEQLRALT